MIITLTAVKEKIRRKELYIVSAIGIFIILLFGTGSDSSSLSINGVAITDYKMLAPILLIVVNAITCVLTSVMSLSTIPNEYERNTSHLIWIRKIPQYRYHTELALSNMITGLAGEAILFGAIIIFMISHDKADELLRLIPTYLIMGINVAIVSLMTSAFTIAMPKFLAGVISVGVTLFGIFYGIIALFKDMVGGLGGKMIKYILKLVPDLNGIQREAGDFLCGNNFDIHYIFVGLLFVYAFVALIFVLRRKEA